MSATIQKGPFEAIINGWNWTGNHAAFVSMLNTQLDPNGPSGADPAPDYHEAKRIAKRIGAKVIRFDVPEYVAERIY
jgi:hypothetical protein